MRNDFSESDDSHPCSCELKMDPEKTAKNIGDISSIEHWFCAEKSVFVATLIGERLNRNARISIFYMLKFFVRKLTHFTKKKFYENNVYHRSKLIGNLVKKIENLACLVQSETKYTEWNKSTLTQTNTHTIDSHYVTFISNYSLFLLSRVRWKLRTDFRFIVHWLIFFVVFYVILKQNEEKLSLLWW